MGEYTECNPPRNDRVAIIWRTIEVDPTEEEWRSLIIDEFMAYLKERGLQKPDSCGVKVDSATMKITLMHKYGIQVPLDFNLYDPNCFDDMAEYMRLYF